MLFAENPTVLQGLLEAQVTLNEISLTINVSRIIIMKSTHKEHGTREQYVNVWKIEIVDQYTYL